MASLRKEITIDAAPAARGPAEVVLFHSLLGLRPALLDWAERLRARGHVVHTPDLYGGRVFDDMPTAAGWLKTIGFDGMLERAVASVSGLRGDLVYAGFSNGGACAELLAATRPGARAAVLVHAPLPIRDLGWSTWPAGVPVQVHFAERDPLRAPAVVEGLGARVRASGSAFEAFTYPCAGHLFADRGLASYHPPSAAALWDRFLDFVEALDGAGARP